MESKNIKARGSVVLQLLGLLISTLIVVIGVFIIFFLIIYSLFFKPLCEDD